MKGYTDNQTGYSKPHTRGDREDGYKQSIGTDKKIACNYKKNIIIVAI